MLKTLTLGIISLLLIITFSGCLDNDTNEYDYTEKILGKWNATDIAEGEDGSIIFNFLSNNSFYINLTEKNLNNELNTQTTWMKYNITKDDLTMMITKNEVILDYSFSNNFTILSFKESNGILTTLNKI